MSQTTDKPTPHDAGFGAIFVIFLRLGLTSFGGPVAHLGFFREAFVVRRRWLDEAAYADLVALCQLLPGPASSQVGLALGRLRGGYAGAAAAWLGFTLPSALLMMMAASGLLWLGDSMSSGMLQGLKIAALAVVAQAVWGMGHTLCPDRARLSLMTTAAVTVWLLPGAWTPVAVVATAALIGCTGWIRVSPAAMTDHAVALPAGTTSAGRWLLLAFALLLLGVPVVSVLMPSASLAMFDAFYRAGALVFGGGHVVLPLLERAVVAPGGVDAAAFVAGYGLAQAVPGPLFAFAAYLGTLLGGLWGGALALVAVFLPGALLVLGALPFWVRLRRHPAMTAVLGAVNAAVVGLLLAVLYDPVWISTVTSAREAALALLAWLALQVWHMPPWLLVGVCGLAGMGLAG